MDLSSDQIGTFVLGGVIAIAGFYGYHHATRRKETIIYRAKLMVAALILYFGGMVVLSNMGYPPSTVLIGGILLGLSAKLIVRRSPTQILVAAGRFELPEGAEERAIMKRKCAENVCPIISADLVAETA